MQELLCAMLREDAFDWPELDDAAAKGVYEAARAHGVHLLLAERAWQRRARRPCPPALGDRLAAALRIQIAVDEIARYELRRVLAALANAGIAPLLIKGTPLAYTHYADPSLRPRFDTDLLIDSAETRAACAVLESLDYRRGPFTSGELVSYQVPFSRIDARGVRHLIDLHWKMSNPQVFAGAFTVEELRRRAVDVPALGVIARSAGPLDALAIACVHRVAHHAGEDRLIWTYDIHLLAERLTAGEQEKLVDLLRAKQLIGVCEDGLLTAHRLFRGARVASLLARLAGTRGPEPSQVYVARRVTKIDVLLSDLEALPGWRQKIKLLGEHLFPPVSYMREAYGLRSAALLPIFYAWRVVHGARRWWRHPGRRSHE